LANYFHQSEKDDSTELKSEVLAAIIQRIFIERKSTLLTESSAFHALDLANTSLRLRAQMLPCLIKLPALAFEPVSGRQPGEEGWTAGEIVSHNSDRLLWALAEAASSVGVGNNVLPQPPEIVVNNAAREPRLLDRDLAVEVLQRANGHLKTMLPVLLTADGGQTKEGTHHGLMSVKSWLLLICIHDDDHLKQLRARQKLITSDPD